jgi:apolipoprotein N-acyltransferase
MRNAGWGAFARSSRSTVRGPSLLTYLVLVVAGWANAASTAWPFHVLFSAGAPLWWLQIPALATLVFCVQHSPSGRHAAFLAQVFGTAWLCSTFWWLYVAMHTYGGLFFLIAGAGLLALAAALSLYYAAVCGLYWARQTSNPLRNSVFFAALWTLAEMARGIWLTGFGWGAIGYAHIDGPLAVFAPWIGAYGMCALAALLAALMAQLHKVRWQGWAIAAVLLVAPSIFPTQWNSWNEWTQGNGTLTVTLLQGNIPQDEKFESGLGIPVALKWYGEQLQNAKVDLVVAPETAIPLLPEQLSESYWNALNDSFKTGDNSALIGIPLGSYTDGYTNSILGLSPKYKTPWQYDKHHLVPFGEFIPAFFKWFTQLMNIPLGDFNRGELGQPSFEVKGQRVGANICYEDLFGEELGVRFADPDKAPTLFANISNLGWFDDTVALDQHLHISRMRALEFQRPFVRATNTGTTAIVDHQAKVVAALPRLTRGVLDGTVEGRVGMTPFASWVSRFGLWPIWILALAVVAAGWYRGRSN